MIRVIDRDRAGAAWPMHSERCICYWCKRSRRKQQRWAEREASPGWPVPSDQAAARITELRAKGYTLVEIAGAAGLSVGVVHKASRPGRTVRRSTSEAILELVEATGRPGVEIPADAGDPVIY